jgi:hypothetical protein
LASGTPIFLRRIWQRTGLGSAFRIAALQQIAEREINRKHLGFCLHFALRKMWLRTVMPFQKLSGRTPYERAPSFLDCSFDGVTPLGLHAMWYERVAGSSADVIQTDKEDLSLASAKSAPRTINAESAISSVTLPVVQTNPNQDPIVANCYMGDYNNITSNGSLRFVTWGDNRNVVTTSTGVTENQPDVFLQSY